MALAIGTAAPDFTLKSTTASGIVDVTLSDHKGKDVVVLLFVPGAFTGVCTKEFCDVSGGVHAIDGAVVYGISIDSPFAQGAWAKANNITIPLLSDYQHKVTQAYDVVWPDFIGLGPTAARAAFVIDKDGVIVYTQVTPTLGDSPDFEPIKAAVAAL